MELTVARCPSCSGELRLDSSKKKGFCMHCGSELIVQEAIQKAQVDGIASVENLLQVAREKYSDGDYEEAQDIYEQCYNLDPGNPDIAIELAACKGLLEVRYDLWRDNVNRSYGAALKIQEVVQGAPCDEQPRLAVHAARHLNDWALYNFRKAVGYERTSDEPLEPAGSRWQKLHDGYLSTCLIFRATFSFFLLETALKILPNNKTLLENLLGLATYHKNYKYVGGKQNLEKIALFLEDGCKASCPNFIKAGISLADYLPQAVLDRTIVKLNNLDDTPVDTAHGQLNFEVFDEDILPGFQSSCYVATAVYGNYNAPQVVTLREFRDQVLRKTPVGRTFINIYYRIGPVLAQKLSPNSLANKVVRKTLDKVVEKL